MLLGLILGGIIVYLLRKKAIIEWSNYKETMKEVLKEMEEEKKAKKKEVEENKENSK